MDPSYTNWVMWSTTSWTKVMNLGYLRVLAKDVLITKVFSTASLGFGNFVFDLFIGHNLLEEREWSVPPQEGHRTCFCSFVVVLFFSFFLFKCFSLISLFLKVLMGAEVQLVEGVGADNTAWTLVSLLTADIDVFPLMTTFEGPGADVSSLTAFKVVRIFLSIAAFSYKTDGTNRCLSLPFLVFFIKAMG